MSSPRVQTGSRTTRIDTGGGEVWGQGENEWRWTEGGGERGGISVVRTRKDITEAEVKRREISHGREMLERSYCVV
jgi:hypothetical protein